MMLKSEMEAKIKELEEKISKKTSAEIISIEQLKFIKENKRVFAVVNGIKIEDHVIAKLAKILKEGV